MISYFSCIFLLLLPLLLLSPSSSTVSMTFFLFHMRPIPSSTAVVSVATISNNSTRHHHLQQQCPMLLFHVAAPATVAPCAAWLALCLVCPCHVDRVSTVSLLFIIDRGSRSCSLWCDISKFCNRPMTPHNIYFLWVFQSLLSVFSVAACVPWRHCCVGSGLLVL